MQKGSTAYRKKWLIVLLLALLLLLAGYRYWLSQSGFSSNDSHASASHQDAGLSQALSACEGITEKAALALPPATLEFQRLEHAGRKARVFRLCMRDRGYQENPRWTAYAQPLAQKMATGRNTDQTSVDEAMENLSRAAMVRIAPEPAAPAYWVNKP